MSGAVLLDFGGTLDADGVPWSQRFYNGYRGLGGSLDRFEFEERFQRSDRLVEDLPDVTGLGFYGLVLGQLTILRSLMPDGEAIDLDAWTSEFVIASTTTVARNRKILQLIRERFTLGVVSNFTGNLEPCLVELELADCFSVLVDSGQLGIRKPDVRLFHRAIDILGVPAKYCWMVGDNPFADIEPAGRIGCRTCWIAPPTRQTPTGVSPTRRIASLADLPAALG